MPDMLRALSVGTVPVSGVAPRRSWALTSIALGIALDLSSCSRSERPAEHRAAPATAASAAEPAKAAPADLLDERRRNPGDMDLSAAERGISRAAKELDDTLALASPDCGLARTLRDRICEIAVRICKLGESDPSIGPRCDDGKNRCADARKRRGAQCP
jgi:hypothetical protein